MKPLKTDLLGDLVKATRYKAPELPSAGLKVIRSNELVMQPYMLPPAVHKLVLYVASQIKDHNAVFSKQLSSADDEERQAVYDSIQLEWLEISVVDAAKAIGLTSTTSVYSDMKKLIERLMKEVVKIPLPGDDGKQRLVHWITKADTDPRGIIRIKLEDDLKPFYIGLNNNWSESAFQSYQRLYQKYSTRLYELFKSHEFRGEWDISVTEFLVLTMLDQNRGYRRFSNLKARVIEPALEEINRESDLIVDCEPVKTGRVVTRLKFKISRNPSVVIVETPSSCDQDPLISRMFALGVSDVQARKLLDRKKRDVLEEAVLTTEVARLEGRVRESAVQYFVGVIGNLETAQQALDLEFPHHLFTDSEMRVRFIPESVIKVWDEMPVNNKNLVCRHGPDCQIMKTAYDYWDLEMPAEMESVLTSTA